MSYKILGQLIFKSAIVTQCRKKNFNKCCWINWIFIWNKNEIFYVTRFCICKKTKWKYIINLRVECKTTKASRKKTGRIIFTTLGWAKIQIAKPYKKRNMEIVNHTLLHLINHTLSKLKTSVLKTSLEKLSGQ